MQLWLERYALPICAAAVFGLCALNPLKLTLYQRAGLALAVTALSLGIASIIHLMKANDKSKRRKTRGKLSQFLDSGQDLMRDCYDEQKDAPRDVAQSWSLKTEEYLSSLGTDYVARFRNPAGVPIGLGSVGNRDRNDLLMRLHIRCFRLSEFIAEIRD